MSDARTTLEVVLKATGFDTGAASIKKLGDEATAANAKLKTTADVVDKTAKSSATIGSKLKNVGSNFSQIGTAAATTALSVVSLSRGYRDLEDSQIAVDKTTRRVSLAQEAYRKATDAVAKAIASGGKGSKAYQQAILDQKQALDKVNIALKDQGEALERQGDINQDFWLNLGTTALAGSSTVVGALSKLGGEQGLGGIMAKLKGFSFSGLSGGLGGLTAVLGPLALAAAAAAVAFIAYDNAMKKVAEAKSEQTLAKNAKTLADELDHTKKSFDALKLKPGTNIVDFFSSLGPGGLQNTFVKWAEDAKTKEIELKTETEALTTAKEKLNKALADPALKSHVTKIREAAEATRDNAQAEVTRLQAIEKTIPATEKLSSSQAALNKAMGENTTLLDVMTKPFTGTSVFNTAAQTIDQLKASFIALNQEADRSQFMKLLSGGNTSATTTKFGPFGGWLESMPEVKTAMEDVFETTRVAGATAMNDVATASAEAAVKIKKDNEEAAKAYIAAWRRAKDEQIGGIQMILDAYEKMNPDRPTTKGHAAKKELPIAQQFAYVEKQFNSFLAGLAPNLNMSAAKQGQEFVITWVSNAVKTMSPMAKTVFGPIIEFATNSENWKLDPQVFMKEFLSLLQQEGKPSLAKTMQEMYTEGVVTPGGEAGAKAAGMISDELGKTKVPDSTISKINSQLATVKANMAKKPAIIKVDANFAAANAKWNAFARKVQMTTLQVKIAGTSVNIRKGSQAGAYGGPKASGYEGTVKRPTFFLAGEGGRQEDISIKPRGSAGGSGGGDVVIGPIYIGEDQVVGQMRYKINKFQGVMK